MQPVLNIADVALREIGNGGAFVGQAGRLGPLIGMKQLGCQLIVLAPGKTAFPLHAHHVNEEMLVVREGTGTYRHGAARLPLRAGDVVAAPAGDAASAHKIINTGDTERRYLASSTRVNIDVVEYPDSGKFRVASQIPEYSGMLSAPFQFIGRSKDSVDYYDGGG